MASWYERSLLEKPEYGMRLNEVEGRNKGRKASPLLISQVERLEHRFPEQWGYLLELVLMFL